MFARESRQMSISGIGCASVYRAYDGSSEGDMSMRRKHWIAGAIVLQALIAGVFTTGAMAKTYTVTSTGESGPGSLRQAVADANANPDRDQIVFADSLPANLSVGASTLGPIEISSDVQIKGPGPKRLQLLNNRNPNAGGRIFDVTSTADTTISGLKLLSVSLDNGGAILNAGSLELRNIVASLCLAYGSSGTIGGGVVASIGAGSRLVVKDSELSDNEALGAEGVPASGGAIYNNGGIVTLDHVELSRNSARTSGDADAIGGGVASVAGRIQIFDSTFDSNHASAPGGFAGGGAIADRGSTTIRTSTLSNNGATGGAKGAPPSAAGGGFYNFDSAALPSDFNIANSTITGNYANIDDNRGVGGGIADVAATDAGGVSSGMASTTIAGNTARRSGANLYSRTPSLVIVSSILANPLGSGNCDVQPQLVLSGGYNIETAHDCFLKKVTDQADTDPKLKALANNGGPTKTMAVPPSSPAVDQGTSFGLSHDQRGEKRPVKYPDAKPFPAGGDGSDIGAFELQPPTSGGHPPIIGSVRPGVAYVGERTCFRFGATRKSGKPIAHARVNFAGKQTRTGRNGKAKLCKTFRRSGARNARINKRGFERDRIRITVRN